MLPDRLRQTVATQVGVVLQSRFFRDRLFVAGLTSSIILTGMMWVLLAIRVHPTDFPVPVHYTTLGGFDVLGPWYEPYLAAFYATVLIVVDLALAYISYQRSRMAAFFLIIGSVVVALFSLIIANAFSSLI